MTLTPGVVMKRGCDTSIIAKAGARILGELDVLARQYGHDIVVASACDGKHSGPDDPHKTGEAYDIRTHDFTPDHRKELLMALINRLSNGTGDPPRPVDIGFATMRFYVQIEDPGGPNEHLHAQRRNGTVYV